MKRYKILLKMLCMVLTLCMAFFVVQGHVRHITAYGSMHPALTSMNLQVSLTRLQGSASGFTVYGSNIDLVDNIDNSDSAADSNSQTIDLLSVETASEVLSLTCASAILMEASTGQIIYEKNSNTVTAPASITKIMTLILIFDAIEAGRISLSDEVTVSEHAASMGGSQVYLEAGEVQTVETMIKCIAIASANDACVAMAEYIGGTEESFVQKMNERAANLGMENTHFVNSCGLDTDGHVSSAMDVAIMSRELITRYPEIHDYSTVWMDTITHTTNRGTTEFGLTNTNKLIKQYQWATGLKTGSTSKAGCCLSATATKDGIDLIAVIMTAPDSKTRFAEAITLLNYGFANSYIYKDDASEESLTVRVTGGTSDYVRVTPSATFSYLFQATPDSDKLTKHYVIPDTISAPVKSGDIVGQIIYKYDGSQIGTLELVATADVEPTTFFHELKRAFRRLLN